MTYKGEMGNSKWRIGVDLGGTKIEALALSPRGEEVGRTRVATPRGDYLGTLNAVAGLVEKLEKETGKTATVGVGIPGTVSPATGLVKNANSTWLIGRHLSDDLEEALGRPVRIANDANCFALSEAVDGAGEGAAVVFGVIIGTGVGGGIVVGRNLLVGPNAIAGEWGHNPLPWPEDDERPGPKCYCGRSGCMETFVSGPAFEQDFERATGRELGAKEIVEAAAGGDEAAEAALMRLEDRMARGLAHVINVLDPDVIVLGGGLSNIERLYSSLPRIWAEWVFSDRVDTRLVVNRHGDSGGVRGAAWLWGGPGA